MKMNYLLNKFIHFERQRTRRVFCGLTDLDFPMDAIVILGIGHLEKVIFFLISCPFLDIYSVEISAFLIKDFIHLCK